MTEVMCKFCPVPEGGTLPEALFVTPATAQLSLVTGVPRLTLVALQPELAETITSGGQVIEGAWVSLTVTVKVQVLLLPLASVAVLVTVVTPIGKVEPEVRLLTRLVTEQLSVALTLKVTLLRLHKPASAVRTRLAGQVIKGALVSRTMTRCTQLLVLPLVSVTVQVTKFVPGRKLAVGALDSNCTL